MGTASHVWPINSHKYSERYRNKNVREPNTTLRQVFLREQQQLHLDRIVRSIRAVCDNIMLMRTVQYFTIYKTCYVLNLM